MTAAGLYKGVAAGEEVHQAGFFVYYTHLSNLLVLAYELALGIGRRGALRWLGSPGGGAECDAVHLCDTSHLRAGADPAGEAPATTNRG